MPALRTCGCRGHSPAVICSHKLCRTSRNSRNAAKDRICSGVSHGQDRTSGAGRHRARAFDSRLCKGLFMLLPSVAGMGATEQCSAAGSQASLSKPHQVAGGCQALSRFRDPSHSFGGIVAPSGLTQRCCRCRVEWIGVRSRLPAPARRRMNVASAGRFAFRMLRKQGLMRRLFLS